MSSIRQILTCLCLAMTVSASIPCRAESGKTSRESSGSGVTMAPPDFRSALQGLQGTANLGTSLPLKAQMQTSGTTSSGHMSGKKKAWIIVGSVLGAIAIAAVVSNQGGGDSGGGGY